MLLGFFWFLVHLWMARLPNHSLSKCYLLPILIKILKWTSIKTQFPQKAHPSPSHYIAPFLSFFLFLRFPGKHSCIKHPGYVFQIKLYWFFVGCFFFLFTVLCKNNMNRNILKFLPLHKNACLRFAIWVCNVNTSLDSHQHFTLINEQHHFLK